MANPLILKEKRPLDANSTSPIKRKMRRSTSDFMYEELFLQGLHSDVTIRALGKDWKLHRSHLCQSEYFSSMFSRKWKEANKKVITVRVPTEVNKEGLQTVFATFYNDEVLIPSENILSVLCAASFFQMENLIDRCRTVMKKSVDAANVVEYFNAATTYSLSDVKEHCLGWMDAVFMQQEECIKEFVEMITLELLECLLDRPTFIVPNEAFLFTVALKFFWKNVLRKDRIEETSFTESMIEDGALSVNDVLPNYIDYTKEPLISRDDAKPYVGLFKKMRMSSLLEWNTWQNLSIVYPRDQVLYQYELYVKDVMAVQTDNALIPTRSLISDEVFNNSCRRCAFQMEDSDLVEVLKGKKYLGWNCGIGLLLSYVKKSRSFCWRLNKNKNKERTALCRMQVLVEDQSGTVTHSARTKIVEVCQVKTWVLNVSKEARIHRMVVSIEALFVMPRGVGEVTPNPQPAAEPDEE